MPLARSSYASLQIYGIAVYNQMHAVIETPDYLADAEDAGMTGTEREHVVSFLSMHPEAGDQIKGTGGARKVRFAGRGHGRSGGYRVITFYSGPDIPLFLLNVFAKGDRVDLSQAERNELRKELAGLVEDYREGVRLYVNRR
jgi:mRNA-degrading endonuclease RelE of RelBE toxin-antitoxin system